HRLRDQRGIAVLVALMCAISAAGLWLLPELAIGWTLLFGFGFRLTGPASMTNAECASDSSQDDNHQPRDSFDSHNHTTSTDFAFRKR
ncbi:hypothetical protein K4G99_23450, partial [Mycobacterium tuberculosis]|nr:hypothetical protein [Mycobacterium tuberculosis]